MKKNLALFVLLFIVSNSYAITENPIKTSKRPPHSPEELRNFALIVIQSEKAYQEGNNGNPSPLLRARQRTVADLLRGLKPRERRDQALDAVITWWAQQPYSGRLVVHSSQTGRNRSKSTYTLNHIKNQKIDGKRPASAPALV